MYKNAVNAILDGILNNTTALINPSSSSCILEWNIDKDKNYGIVKDMFSIIKLLSQEDMDMQLNLRVCGDCHLFDTVAEICLDACCYTEEEIRQHYTKCITGQINDFSVYIITSGPMAGYICIRCNHNAIILFIRFSIYHFIISKNNEHDFHFNISDLPVDMLWAVLYKLSYKKNGGFYHEYTEKISEVDKICGYINDLISDGILDADDDEFLQPYIYDVAQEFADSKIEHKKIMEFINKRIYPQD